MTLLADAAPCPCQSGLDYGQCCSPLHRRERPADSPEALMRSRFCAYVLGDLDWLRDSWHPHTRPASVAPDPEFRWTTLTVLESSEDGDHGTVHFRALGHAGGDWLALNEVSRFTRIDGCWHYHSGEISEQPLKPGRNDPCPCNSGRKFKRCCDA